MSAAILNFMRAKARPEPRDWSDQELAEFYRVADALTQSGFDVTTERGLTDEGDPWFVFIREASDDVIAHFARIEGEFLADASMVADPVRGTDLRNVLDQVLNRYTVFMPTRKSDNLFMHPVALLTAFVATALLEIERSDQKSALGRDPASDADRVHGAADRTQDAAKADDAPKSDEDGKAAARLTAASANGATPSNAPGRAVSFNESGTIGDHSLHSSVIMTAVMAALGSLYTFSAAAEQHDDGGTPPQQDLERVERKAPTDADHASVLLLADDAEVKTSGKTAPDDVVESADPGQDNTSDTSSKAASSQAQINVITQSDTGDIADVVFGALNLGADDRGMSPKTALGTKEAQLHRPEAADPSAEGESPDPAAMHSGGDALVSFEGVTLQLEALQALFDAEAWSFLREDSEETDAQESDNETQTPDSGPPGPPPEGAPAPSVADFVFEGSDSQNAVLRHVVEFVLNGQKSAAHLDISEDSAAYKHARIFAEEDGSAPDFVIFESDDIGMKVFDFMPGVVFVDGSLLEQTPVTFDHDSTEIELSGGGSVLLIGVADVDLV